MMDSSLECLRIQKAWCDFLGTLQDQLTQGWIEDVARVFELYNRYRPEKILTRYLNGVLVAVFLHSTKRGAALGGTRRRIYRDMTDFLLDGLRLSCAMTYKAIWARILLGGGKAIIWAPPESINEQFAKEYAEFLNEINSSGTVFITGEDVGFSEEIVDTVAMYTPYISGKSVAAGGLGDPSPITAEGVFLAAKTIVESGNIFYGTLKGKVAAVQGAGKVAFPLIRMLLEAGVEVFFSENDGDLAAEERAKKAQELGAKRVPRDDIYKTECHIFMPCALGGVINQKTIRQLSPMCRIIVGSANNVLDTPEDGVRLHEKRIYYAPDYVVNRWGLEWVWKEKQGQGVVDFRKARQGLTNISRDVLEIFELSQKTNIAPSEIADTVSKKILEDETKTIDQCLCEVAECGMRNECNAE